MQYIKVVKKEKPCLNCSNKFLGHGGRKYCSDKCRNHASYIRNNSGKYRKTNIPCKYCKKTTPNKKGVCSKCSKKPKPNWNPGEYNCVECGNEFYQKQSTHKFCSEKCSEASKRRKKKKAAIKKGWKPKIVCNYKFPMFKSNIQYFISENGISIKESSKKQPLWEIDNLISIFRNNPKECIECGVFFSALNLPNRVRFCSNECCNKNTRRIQKSKRKAIETNGEVFDPFDVFEEHSWTCNNCGVSTPKELRGKHLDNSPELDHIFPLSKGGSHTKDNVQLLCRKCNAEKSDKII